MHLRRLAFALSSFTFVLLLVGGVVHSTGSSLACPDWPLCYGQVFPPMRGGILFEHSHRLLASLVGVLTVALAIGVRRHRDPAVRRWAWLGVALVVFQGCLGGLTVIFRLPPPISIAHLGTSMAFFAWTLFMNLRLRPLPPGGLCVRPLSPRLPVAAVAGLVYLQIVLGAAVRHTASSMSCGTDVITCLGSLVPETGPQWLQTAHRVLAVATLIGVIWATIPALRAARLSKRPNIRPVCIMSHILILMQIILGVLTVKTAVHMHVVTTHLAVGALLWGCMVTLYLLLGPLGRRDQTRSASSTAYAPGSPMTAA